MQDLDQGHPYRQELYRVLEERKWLDNNIDELMRQYALRWIALQDHEVIAVADEVDGLKQQLMKRGIEECRMVFFVPASVHRPL